MTKPETATLLFARLTGVALLYFLSGLAGLEFAVVGHTVTLVWPPSGIALVATLIFGYRMAAGIFVGAFLVNALTDVSGFVAAGIAVGNTLEALAGAFLLRLARFRPALDRRRDVFAFISVAATLATMLSASVGVLALMLAGEVPTTTFVGVWLTWWLGDMMGVLVMAPLLLLGFSQPLPLHGLRQGLEALALLVGTLAIGYGIFLVPDPSGRGGLAAALAMLPFVIWGALRFSLWGASLVTLVFSVLAIWGTVHGNGPFAVGPAQESLLLWCAFTNLLAITGLLLAASGAEERRSHRALQEAHGALEQRVRERTAELARINVGLQQEMAERRRLEGALIQADEKQQRALGRELHDGLGQQLTSTAFFAATLAQRLERQGRPEAEAAQRIVTLTNQAIDMVRALARGLYPAALESAGLRAALQELADNTRMLNNVDCELWVGPTVHIDEASLAIHLYRIAQESVNNALKHGQAKHINISLETVAGQHRLTVSDDGCGFDPAELATGPGMGLHNLRYRAALLGGELIIDSQPRVGATVTAVCPLLEGAA